MTINGKSFEPARLSFSAMRKMEKAGLTVSNMADRPLQFITLYAALSMDVDEDAAAAELDKHLEGGGDLNEISEALNHAVEDSGFFKTGTETEKKV